MAHLDVHLHPLVKGKYGNAFMHKVIEGETLPKVLEGASTVGSAKFVSLWYLPELALMTYPPHSGMILHFVVSDSTDKPANLPSDYTPGSSFFTPHQVAGLLETIGAYLVQNSTGSGKSGGAQAAKAAAASQPKSGEANPVH